MSRSEKPQAKRAIVVGGGVVGSSCAAHLQRDGFDVVIFDPDGAGRGCAEGTCGIFATCNLAPVSSAATVQRIVNASAGKDPRQLVINTDRLPEILPWFAAFVRASTPERGAAVTNALTGIMSRAIPATRDILGDSVFREQVKQTGWLHVYDNEESFLTGAGERDLRRGQGVAVEEMGSREIAELEPALGDLFAYGAFMPEIYSCGSPYRLARAMVDRALSQGARIEERRVERIERAGERGFNVFAGGETFAADLVVLSAGPYSAALAESLGSPLPHAPERGYSLTIRNANVNLNRAVSFARKNSASTSAALMEDGLRFSLPADFTGLGAPADFGRIDRIREVAEAVFPGIDLDDAHPWFGDRSATPDGMPVIGSSPHHPGLFFAFGHGHVGLTLAGITGEIISALAACREPPIDVSPFRIERFQS